MAHALSPELDFPSAWEELYGPPGDRAKNAEWEPDTAKRQEKYKIIPECWIGDEFEVDREYKAQQCYMHDGELGLRPEADFEVKDARKVAFHSARFFKYQELEYELFAARRMDRLRGDLPMPTYTDRDILKEMTQLYGEMDRSSDKFKRMFGNYKKSFLEQVAKCEAEEEKVKQECERSGKSLIIPSYNSAAGIEKHMRFMFKPEEHQLYRSVDPKKNDASGADWLDVPRRIAKQNREATSRLLKMDDEAAQQVIPNLAELDPKYYEFPKWTTRSENIGLALRRSIDKLIHAYPYGLSADMFFQRFKDKHGYFINFRQLGFESAAAFFEELKDIMYMATETPNSKAIIFPGSFQDWMLPLNVVMKKMRHAVMKELVYNNGIIDLSTLAWLLRADQDFPMEHTDWGFTTAAEFVRGIFHKSEHPGWRIEHVYLTDDDGVDRPKEYLISDTPRMRDFIEKLKETSDENKNKDEALKRENAIDYLGRMQGPCIPLGFAQRGDHYFKLSDTIQKGDTYSCTGIYNINPFQFFLVLNGNWGLLNAFQGSVQDQKWQQQKTIAYKEEFLSDKNLEAIRKDLVVGLPVMAYCKGTTFSDGDKKDWYRGTITALVKDRFQVFLVDYGLSPVLGIDDIKLLPIDLMNELAAQAIPACMFEVPSKLQPTKKRKHWDPVTVRRFKLIMKDKDLFFHFCNKKGHQWEVKIGKRIPGSKDISFASSESLLEVVSTPVPEITDPLPAPVAQITTTSGVSTENDRLSPDDNIGISKQDN